MKTTLWDRHVMDEILWAIKAHMSEQDVEVLKVVTYRSAKSISSESVLMCPERKIIFFC